MDTATKEPEITMEDALAVVDAGKTLKMFPHVIAHTIEELTRANTLIRFVAAELEKIEMDSADLSKEIGILQLVGHDLFDREDLLRGLLFE